MKYMKLTLLLTLMTFTQGCQSTSEIRVVEVPACDGFRIITVSKDDKLTMETARQILSHNEYLERCRNQ